MKLKGINAGAKIKPNRVHEGKFWLIAGGEKITWVVVGVGEDMVFGSILGPLLDGVKILVKEN